eukprot:1293521-Prorocentrum_lima.AAC.1
MTSSLVGSEMCIRDSCQAAYLQRMQVLEMSLPADAPTFGNRVLIAKPPNCLLYTSDAADDM